MSQDLIAQYTPPIAQCTFILRNRPEGTTLAAAMRLLEQHVAGLQPFWATMDELQSVFVVLDPSPLLPKYAGVETRRLGPLRPMS